MTTITGLVLDTAIELQSGTTGVAISTLNGTVVLGETATVGPAREITFSTALEDDDAIAEGCMASFGVVGEEYGRFIVDDIQPASDSMARVVLVDEAPSVFRGAGPSLARRLLDAWGGTGMAVDFTDGSLRIFDADHPELIFDGPFADRLTITGALSPSSDGCYFDASNYATLDAVLTPWTDSAMTMFVVFNVPAILGAVQIAMTIDNGGTANRHYVAVSAGGNIQITTATSSSNVVNRTPVAVSTGTWYGVAYGMTTNDANQAIDGTIGTADTVCTAPTGLSTIRFGIRSGAVNPLTGYIRRALIVPQRLSDTVLPSLSLS